MLLWSDSFSHTSGFPAPALSVVRSTGAFPLLAMKADLVTSLVHCYMPGTWHLNETLAKRNEVEE